ncbi:DoxX family protein [Nocardia thailandica]|uniref:DoxX family protein n=1 Tax=Nocardia thailandica TaxID=257275 RepID=UPI0002E0ADE7|nr:DoxX family protein [Nocardia thailandica]
MSLVYLAVTVLAAFGVAFTSVFDVIRGDDVRAHMSEYGLPHRILGPLAVIKAAGALGLLAGLFLPPLGLIAAVCLVVYFLLAEATIVRAGRFGDLGYPLPYLVLSAGSLALYPFA